MFEKIIAVQESTLGICSDRQQVLGVETGTLDVVRSLFREGVIPEDRYPSQLQMDLTRFCSLKSWVNDHARGLTSLLPPKDCRNCSFPQDDIRHYMPFSVISASIERYARYGGRSIFFTGGGEPGEHPSFIQALQQAARNGLEFSFNTWGPGIFKLNALSQEDLLGLYAHATVQEPFLISVSVHDLANRAVFDSIAALARTFFLNGVPARIRTTLLVRKDILPQEITDFIIKSDASGAAVAAIKPAYSYYSQRRQRSFQKNTGIVDSARRAVHAYNGTMQVQLLRLDRLLKEIRPAYPVCFSPLDKIYMNTFERSAMCCDAKDEGQGGMQAMVFGSALSCTPHAYYRNALLGMLTHTPGRNCVPGCNMHEFNEAVHQYLQNEPRYQVFLDVVHHKISDRAQALSCLFRNWRRR